MWPEIRPANNFMDDPAAACGTRRPHLSLLAQVTDDGRLADEFRVAINAAQAVRVRFEGSDIFAHKQFHHFTFTYPVNPSEVSFPVGHLVTDWVNIHELVSAGRLLSVREGDGPDFLQVWEKHAADISRPGGSVRWGVTLDDGGGAELMLQGLPADAGKLKGIPVLRMDDAPIIKLGSVELSHDRDPDVGSRSIRPILYAAGEREAAEAIGGHPGVYYAGLRRIWQRFFVPEELTAADAVHVVRQPREGATYHPLGRAADASDAIAGGGRPPGHQDRPGGVKIPIPGKKKFDVGRVKDKMWVPSSAGNEAEKILMNNVKDRISEGLAEKTWGRHSTVWGAINSFAAWTGRRLDWLLSEEDILKFASWCDVERKLQASTIKTYLQSLSKIQQLRGGPRICLSKIPLLQDFLAGVRNVPRIPRKSVKKTVSFPLLQILGQVVGRDESKTTFDKLRFWTVCLWSFFGSFRIGELLSEQKKNYDPHRTLLWKDVGLTNKDELTIPIKSPKVPRPGGEIVLLFPCKDRTVCPVRLFQEYQEVARETGLVEDDLPVFRNEDGTSWSKSEFRNELDYFMAQTGVVRTGEKIVCHSFRGGIPSMLESLGTPEAEGASQEWGRWRSSAYKCYTHYHLTKKRKIFETVCSLLLN
jgi:hypothetical protein